MKGEQQPAPADVLKQVQEAWQGFWSAASGLNDSELSRAGASGEWSGKEVLTHVSRWMETGAVEIQHHTAGQPAGDDYSDYLAWNDRWAAEDTAIPAEAARRRCSAAHATLFATLTSLSAEQWDGMVREWVENTTTGHFQEHTEQFLAWRAANPSDVISPTV